VPADDRRAPGKPSAERAPTRLGDNVEAHGMRIEEAILLRGMHVGRSCAVSRSRGRFYYGNTAAGRFDSCAPKKRTTRIGIRAVRF
jgi:hypothetical protein